MASRPHGRAQASRLSVWMLGIQLRGAANDHAIVMLTIMSGPWLVFRLLARGGSAEKRNAAGSIGLGLLFLFTGAGHFLQTEAMAEILPPFIPARIQLIYATGLLEWAIALGFFVPRWRFAAGMVAAAVLIAFFPANIYAAFAQVPMGGHAWGPVYLLIRAPLQLAIILWSWRFAIQPGLRHYRVPTFSTPSRGACGRTSLGDGEELRERA